jgi:hypothetical protein
MSYFRLVCSRALAETKIFWNIHKIWVSLSVPISGLLLRFLVNGRNPVNGWLEVVEFTIFGFIFSWIGTFLINLVRTPALLHREQDLIIGGFRNSAQTEDSAQEERKRQNVREILAKFNDADKRVFQFIHDNGEISPKALARTQKFERTLLQVLDRGVRSNLLKKKVQEGQTLYSVNPELKSALGFVLNENAHPVSTSPLTYTR